MIFTIKEVAFYNLTIKIKSSQIKMQYFYKMKDVILQKHAQVWEMQDWWIQIYIRENC